MINRRKLLGLSVSVPALLVAASSRGMAFDVQGMTVGDQALKDGHCTTAPHAPHLQKALALLAAAGVPVPLTAATGCPICGCTINP
jgi:hypothetical protein